MSIPYQTQYANITKRILYSPNKISKSRIGDVNSRFCEQIRVDLTKEFPLQDIKKIKPSNIIHELLWMLRGETNIKYLIENDCHIWTDDAYRYFKEKYQEKFLQNLNDLNIFKDNLFSKEDFVRMTLDGKSFKYVENIVRGGKSIGQRPMVYRFGDLDRVYGVQWRQFNGMTDQISNCIKTLKTNPDDRRMIVTAHNPSELEMNIVGLPSCHNYFQFYTTINKNGSRNLSTFVNIRSNDFALGNPYNVAQYALLTHIVAKIVNMGVGELVINSVDCHIYHSHFSGMKEWLSRYDKIIKDSGHLLEENDWYGAIGCESRVSFKKDYFSIDDLNANDIEITNYNPQSFIKMKLLT